MAKNPVTKGSSQPRKYVCLSTLSLILELIQSVVNCICLQPCWSFFRLMLLVVKTKIGKLCNLFHPRSMTDRVEEQTLHPCLSLRVKESNVCNLLRARFYSTFWHVLMIWGIHTGAAEVSPLQYFLLMYTAQYVQSPGVWYNAICNSFKDNKYFKLRKTIEFTATNKKSTCNCTNVLFINVVQCSILLKTFLTKLVAKLGYLNDPIREFFFS